MTPKLIKLIARFVHADTGLPLTGPGLRARFYDADALTSDFLGQSALSHDGVAEVIFNADDFQTGLLGKIFDRFKERKPDIYCEIADKNGDAIFRSTVQWNVDPLHVDEVTRSTNPTLDLGTYRFRRGQGLIPPGPMAGIPRPPM